MKSNDTQFEAMASYFRSMLNPVSSQEIEEKLAGKLASSGLVADGVVKVSSEQNRPEESPVIEESVKVTDESSDVVETDGRESETEQKNSTASDADQSCQIPVIQAEKSQERDEIKNGTGEKPEATSSEEKNTDASGIENEHDLSAEPQKQDTVQKQPETHADLLSTENTQKSEQQSETQPDAAKGTTDAVTPADGAIVASFGKTYTPKAIVNQHTVHLTLLPLVPLTLPVQKTSLLRLWHLSKRRPNHVRYWNLARKHLINCPESSVRLNQRLKLRLRLRPRPKLRLKLLQLLLRA